MHAFRSTSALSFRTSAAAHLPTRSRTPRTTIVARRLRVQGLKEGATGVEFPDSSGTLKCLGTGVRVKKVAILNVNVYAMALYAEPAGLKAAGGELLDGVFDKAMCLTLARDVDSKTMVEALETAVKPRLARIATDAATAANDDGNFMSEVAEAAEKAEEVAFDQLDEMRDFLLTQKFAKGFDVVFSFPASGGLALSTGSGALGGDAELTLSSNELAKALLDIWVGDDPLEPKALAAFRSGAQALL